MNAEQAIKRSISHNEIVHLAHEHELVEDLQILSEGSVKANTEYEFWGADDEGNDWRVHVALEGGRS